MSDKSNILASLLAGVARPSSKVESVGDKEGSSRATSGGGKQHKLRQRFNVIRKLGKGAYGKVQLAINKETGQEVAIKTIKKTKIENELDMERVRREIQIMSSIEHPHIVHIYEVFENKDKIVLVMQYAPGGELYEYVSDAKVLDEAEARRLFRQIATAIYYCHKNKICHRDLKLENILLDEKNNAKLADFGLSNVFDKKRQLKTFCGSPLYASPEIVQGSPYEGPEVDCWSLGVLLYTLVYGAMPFDGSNFKRLVKQISESCYFEPKQKSHASPLIKRLLCADPNKRATIVDICSDPWVNGMVGLEHQHNSLLQVAQDMANLTPVRLDILMALAPAGTPPIQPEEQVSNNKMAARPPLGPIQIENIPESKLEQEEIALPVATFVLRDLEPKKVVTEEQEKMMAPPPFDTQPILDKTVIESMEQKLVQGEEKEDKEEPPRMEVIDAENVLYEGPVVLDVKEEELNEIPMELDTVVYQKPSSPVPVTVDVAFEDTEDNQRKESLTEPMSTDGPKEEEKQVETNDVTEKIEEEKVVDEKAEDKKEPDEKVEDKPKKVKKKVLVKRKKKVSKKDKEGDEQKVSLAPTSDNSSTKPGKIQIPDTFTSTPDPSEAPLPPRPTEGRRQSALIADVAQKLFQQNNQQAMKHDDDLHELANVRIIDKKSEFERRASSSSGAPSYSHSSLEHRRRSSVARQGPQPGKVELLREPSNELQTSLVELASIRVPCKAKELSNSNRLSLEQTNLQVPKQEGLNDSQETIKPETPNSPVQVRSELSIKLGSGSQQDVEPTTRMQTPTLVPIARSYKKVTFTKDGACVTETGRVISTELPDGTIRKIDRRSKVTHYVNSNQQQHPQVHRDFSTVTSSTSEFESQQFSDKPDYDPFSRLVMPSSNLQLHHNNNNDYNNRHNNLQANESCSSLSSGSTDAFEDIFDTWTSAFQHGLPSAHFSHFPSGLLGRHSRHGHSGSGHRSGAASPRCGSADPSRGCWGTAGSLQRPPVWPASPAASGYESDAGSRATGIGQRFDGSSMNGRNAGLRSSGANLLSSRVEDLHLSITEEHERLRQRIARQHKNFWKGSTPSLFSVSEKDPVHEAETTTTTTTTSSLRMSPASRPPRPEAASVQQQRVIRTTSVKTKIPITQHQEQVEQSLSSTSFIQQSVALDPSPRRQPPGKPPMASDSFTSLIKSSSRTSVQSSGVNFIGLKKSSSIKHRLQQHQMDQADERARVQSWLQHSEGAPSTLSSGSSGSSFGLSTNNSTMQRNCSHVEEATKTSGSISSVSHQESSAPVHPRTFQLKSSTTELPLEFGSPLEPQTSRKSPLVWMQNSLLEENEEGEVDEVNELIGAPLRSGSLLDQLRSHGYRTMINQRMEFEEGGVGAMAKHLFATTKTSSSTTSFVTESGTAKTQQKQQHFITTTTTTGSSSQIGEQKTLANDDAAAGGSQQQKDGETAKQGCLIDARVSSNCTKDELTAGGCSAATGNNKQLEVGADGSQVEAGCKKDMIMRSGNVAPSDGQVQRGELIGNEETQVERENGDGEEEGEADEEEEEEEEEEDEDIRHGKEAVKEQLKRMRETELFLKTLQKDEEQEQVRKQSFLFDNMILNARLSSELARANALTGSKTNLWSAGSSMSGGSIDQAGVSTPHQQQQTTNTTSNSALYDAPSSAPILLQDLQASPFMSSFTSSSTYTAPILAPYRRPLWTSVSNPPPLTEHYGSDLISGLQTRPTNKAGGIAEFRRSHSQLGTELTYPSSRQSRSSLREMNPLETLETSAYHHDTSYQARPRFRSQSQARQMPSSFITSSRHRTPGPDRWRRELSVNPATSLRATSPLASPTTSCLRLAPCSTPEPSSTSDEDTLHQDDVERFGLAKFRVSAHEPSTPPSAVRQSHRRRSLQPTSITSISAHLACSESKENQEACETRPEVVSRRYSTVSEGGEKAGGSRLEELEQRILANKKRRDELLASGGSYGSATRDRQQSVHRGASPCPSLSPSAGATASSSSGGGRIFGSQRRASSRLSAAPDQLITSSSSSFASSAARPSRLESMEARIKRRSYCVRLGDCSPERAPSRPVSLSLEGWKRIAPTQPDPSRLQAHTAGPDRLDARVSALNDQLDYKWCRAGRENNMNPED